MLIEFQLGAARLLDGFRNRFSGFAFCAPEFPVGPGGCSGPTFLDHIDIHDTTALRRAPAPTTPVAITKQNGQTVEIQIARLQVTQPITVHLVRRAHLRAAGAQPAPSCFDAEVVLVFDLTVQAGGGSAELCVELAELAADALDPTTLGALEALVAGELPATCTEFDLAPLEEMTGGPAPVVNAGFSAGGAALDFVAIRLEVGSAAAGAETAWASFYAGGVSDKLFGDDWSVFVDKRLILPPIEDRVSAGIAEYNAGQWFDYNIFWGPDAEWSNPNGASRITVKVDGEKEQACVCYLFPQDIEIELDSTIDLSVGAPDQLTTVVSLDTISHDDFSIACCSETNMLGWALLGPHWLGEADSEEFWGAFLLGWGFLPAVFFASLVMAGDAAGQIPLPSPSGATCTKDPDEPITTCTQPLALGDSDLLGHFTVTALHGRTGGPVLSGTLTPAPPVEQAGLLVLADTPFEWQWDGACGTSPRRVAAAHAGAHNTSATPTLAPLQLCQATVIDDPPPGNSAPSQYAPWLVIETADGAYHSISVVVPEAEVTAEYLADPWPLRLLIATSAGVREIAFDPIVMLTDEEKEASDTHLQVIRATQCKLWAQFWHAKLFLPKWWTDPPPVKVEAAHLWQVAVSGLVPGESFTLRRPRDGTALGTSSANAGIAQLSAFVEAMDGDDDVEIAVGEHGDHDFAARSAEAADTRTSGAATSGRRRLQIKQLQLLRHATIRLPRPAVGLALGRRRGMSLLACATDRDLRIYDVSAPALPRLVRRERWPGARGVAFASDRLVAWGAEGLYAIDVGGERPAPPQGGWPRLPVRASDVGRGNVYALMNDTIHVYDRSLRLAGEIEAPRASTLAVAGRTLFLAVDDGLLTYSLDEADRPLETGRKATGEVDRFARPVLPNATESVFVGFSGGGGEIVHASSGRDPVSTARFGSDPWFVDVVQRGALAARRDPTGLFVTLFVSGLAVTSSDGSGPPQPIEGRTAPAARA